MKFDQRSPYDTESSTMTTRFRSIAATRIVLHYAADDRRRHAPAQRHADEWRVHRLRHEWRPHVRGAVDIEQCHVADRAALKRSARQPEDARRSCREKLDEA